MKGIRVRCTVCGKISSGRLPRGGDGSTRFPRRHQHRNDFGTMEDCPGEYRDAEWIIHPLAPSSEEDKGE